MTMLERYNKQGIFYALFNEGPNNNQTRIVSGRKGITVDFPLAQVEQAWYLWTMSNHFIQDAFSFLNSSEREFLITGITEMEWNEIFKEE